MEKEVMRFLLLSALRRVIQRHSAASLPSVPSNNEKIGYGQIQLQKKELFFDILNRIDSIEVVESENPLPMESVGQVGENHIL
jgi:beta-galactosidase